jgi:hypothetical protein
VAGGVGAGGTTNSTSETYDASTNTWKLTGSNMAYARADFTLTGFRAAFGYFGGPSMPTRIVAAGGRNAAGTFVGSFEEFEMDATGGHWKPTVTPMAYPVFGHTAVASTKAGAAVAVIAGGVDATGHTLRMVQALNKDTMATVPMLPLLSDRLFHAAFMVPSTTFAHMFLFGGYSHVDGAKMLSTYETYDVSAGTPLSGSTLGDFSAYGQAREQMAASSINGTMIVVSGGVGASSASLADSIVYTF